MLFIKSKNLPKFEGQVEVDLADAVPHYGLELRDIDGFDSKT